jgi:predicted transcriptional regulator
MLREALNDLPISSLSGYAKGQTPTCAILSIKPIFADAIFRGEKKFEYRRKLFRNFVPQTVFVYASAPISQVIGYFEIGEILTACPSRLWAKTKSGAGISKTHFFEYFRGCRQANAIRVRNAILFNEPLDLAERFGVTRAPQSFCYVTSPL